MIATINNIPVYEALISDDECGMNMISLVDSPAVMSNFLQFAEEKKPLSFSIKDEEKRLIFGCIMRANFPIYRYHPTMGEFYIIYKPETIRQMAEKYLSESKQNNVNEMHTEGTDLEGVQMVQWFIKDTERGIVPSGFAEDIADGSLFAEFHVINDEAWEKVKKGEFKGFSLEGVFDLAPEQNQDEVTEIADHLEGQFKSQKKTLKTRNMKVKRLFNALAKALSAFGSITTDKGVLAWDGDEDLKVGDKVVIEVEEGDDLPAEDGDYKTEDNKVIVVVDGVVTEIKDAEAEVAPENTTEETEMAEEEETTETAEETEEVAEEVAEVVEEASDKVAELEAKIAELIAENEALKAKVAELTGENTELRKMSGGKSAHEEFESSAKRGQTGIKGLDNLAKIASA